MKMPTWLSNTGNFGVWVAIGLPASLALDYWVNLSLCDYDACRYLLINTDIFDFLGDADLWTGEQSTLFMHAVYGHDGLLAPGFLRSFLINVTLTGACIPLFGWRNPIFRSPLAFAFFVLPGKEFFLILSIAFFAKAKALLQICYYHPPKPRSGLFSCFSSLAMLIPAITFAYIGRPGFILIIGIAMILGNLWVAKRRVLFILAVVTITIIGVEGAGLLGRSHAEGGGFDVDASIGLVNYVREYTANILYMPIAIRALIYLVYLVALPFLELYRLSLDLFSVGLMPFHVYILAGILEWLKWTKLADKRNIAFGYSIVAAFAIAMSFPFLHTRYLFPVLVAMITLGRSVPFAETKLKTLLMPRVGVGA